MDRIHVAWSAFSARVLAGRRGALLLYSALVAGALLAVSWLIAARAREEGYPVSTLAIADMLSMMAAGAGLFVVAPAMVAAQVGEERRSGTLDLLRTAPLSPTALAVGFIAGAPASLYLLLVGPLGLHVAAAALGVYPIGVLPQSLLVLAVGSVVLMLVAMLTALSIGRERAGNAIAMVIAGALAILGMSTVGMAGDPPMGRWAIVHPAGALANLYIGFAGPYRDAFVPSWRLDRFVTAPWDGMLALSPGLAVLLYLVVGAILLVAARRALAGDPPAYLSKAEAIGLFTTAAAALLLPMRLTVEPADLDMGYVGGTAFFLAPVYIACVLGATPTSTGYDQRAARLSSRGAPLLGAVLMVAAAIALLLLLFGGRVFAVFEHHRQVFYALGFGAVALTFPIYALYASTRIGAAGARLAFWAGISALIIAQIPSLIGVREGGPGVPRLLAQIGCALGVAVPVFIAWRQRVGDRRMV